MVLACLLVMPLCLRPYMPLCPSFFFFPFSFYFWLPPSLAFPPALASHNTDPLLLLHITSSSSLHLFFLTLLVYRWLPPLCINACNAALSSGEADLAKAWCMARLSSNVITRPV